MKQRRFSIANRRIQPLVLLGIIAFVLLFAAVAFAQGDSKGGAFGSGVEYRTLFDADGSMGWLNPRVIVWVLAQLHLLFAAFVLAVPMFVVIIEAASIFSKDPAQAKRYDELAYEFTRLLTTAFSITSIIGALFTFVCIGLYPKVFGYMAHIFGPSMYLYACIFFGESFSLYLYYYGWGKMSKGKHLSLGLLLNVFGITLMLIANAWTTFAMAPGGVVESGPDVGALVDRSAAFWNFLLHPINIHRLIANLCMGGSVAAAYAAYKFLTTEDKALQARYDWMGYIGNFIAILALLPLPFAGYYLGYEIYQFDQGLGIYMMGGKLSWLFVMQAVLIGALFFAANYYLWLGMDRIEGAERFRGWIKFLLFTITVCILVWATPKSLVAISSSAEVDAMGGSSHPILATFGLMSAKNTAVNLLILATFLSFLLYRRGNKVPTVSWAKAGTAAQALLFGAAAAVVIVIGIGGYIPGWWLESTKRVAMSPYQVLAVLACIAVVMPLDIFMLRGAKEIGKIRWGQVSKRAQYTLFFLAVSFTWLMALMGFVRSSLRKDWHVYNIMRDTSPENFTPAIGYATMVVTAVVILFFLLVAFVVWIANLGHAPKGVAEKSTLSMRQKLGRTVGALAVVFLLVWMASRLTGPDYTKADTSQRDEIAAQADTALDNYGIVDPETGVFSVPGKVGMNMLASNPGRYLEAPVKVDREALAEMSAPDRGKFYFEKEFGCSGCHKLNSTGDNAPHLNGRFGGETTLVDGSNKDGKKMSFNEVYFKKSVTEPQADIVKGYAKPKFTGAPMTKFDVSSQQLSDLMAYLSTL